VSAEKGFLVSGTKLRGHVAIRFGVVGIHDVARPKENVEESRAVEVIEQVSAERDMQSATSALVGDVKFLFKKCEICRKRLRALLNAFECFVATIAKMI
jgi:hypothetical protein